MIEIRNADETKILARSQNLRGILDYARKSPVAYVSIWKTQTGGEAYIRFDNGAVARPKFADYRVLCDWIVNRRSWNLYNLAHWPESRSYSAS